MRLHRFFIAGQKLFSSNANATEASYSIASSKTSSQSGNTVVVSDPALCNQLKNVLRFHTGDTVILLDNTGFEHVSQIVSFTRDSVEFQITNTKKSENMPSREVWLFQSIVKKDNFEWIVEKATELGVSHIRPIISDRSEKKDLNFDRLMKIVKESSEQSERGSLPALYEVITLDQVLKDYHMPAVAFHTSGETFSKEQFASQNTLAVFIGPEGGWSDRELALFQEKNIPVRKVGDTVLRAETAATSILSLILLKS